MDTSCNAPINLKFSQNAHIEPHHNKPMQYEPQKKNKTPCVGHQNIYICICNYLGHLALSGNQTLSLNINVELSNQAMNITVVVFYVCLFVQS